MSLMEALKSGVTAHSVEGMEAIGRGLVVELFDEAMVKRGSAKLMQPKVIALKGDLGSGKTTLVRGIAAALGIESVTSPSFNYYFLYKAVLPFDHSASLIAQGLLPEKEAKMEAMDAEQSLIGVGPEAHKNNPPHIGRGQGDEKCTQLLHLDAYRLGSPEDYPSLMIDELLTPETLFVIEWPEKMEEYLPKDAIVLELVIVGEGVHRVKVTN